MHQQAMFGPDRVADRADRRRPVSRVLDEDDALALLDFLADRLHQLVVDADVAELRVEPREGATERAADERAGGPRSIVPTTTPMVAPPTAPLRPPMSLVWWTLTPPASCARRWRRRRSRRSCRPCRASGRPQGTDVQLCRRRPRTRRGCAPKHGPPSLGPPTYVGITFRRNPCVTDKPSPPDRRRRGTSHPPVPGTRAHHSDASTTVRRVRSHPCVGGGRPLRAHAMWTA